MRGGTPALLFVAAAVALPGCGGGEERADAAGGAVDVALSDFSIDPASIEVEDAGELTLNVRNDGEVPHALSLDDASTGTLAAGADGRLTVDLAPGTYELFCPVGDHRRQGMVAMLRVAGGGAGGGTTTGEDDDDTGRDYGYG